MLVKEKVVCCHVMFMGTGHPSEVSGFMFQGWNTEIVGGPGDSENTRIGISLSSTSFRRTFSVHGRRIDRVVPLECGESEGWTPVLDQCTGVELRPGLFTVGPTRLRMVIVPTRYFLRNHPSTDRDGLPVGLLP